MRILISAGGTGGGVYPALAVAQALASIAGQKSSATGHAERSKASLSARARLFASRRVTTSSRRVTTSSRRVTTSGEFSPARAGQAPEIELIWIGGKGGMERDLVTRATVAGAAFSPQDWGAGGATATLHFEAMSAAGVHGVGVTKLPANLLQLARGFFEALKLVRRYRPAAVFLTGGYVAVPVGLAAWLQRRPIVLYVPDIEPGQALKVLSRLAARIMVTTEESRRYFPARANVVVSGYPTRPELGGRGVHGSRSVHRYGGGRAPPTKVSGRPLDPDRDTVLVFGGSRGARSINRALAGVAGGYPAGGYPLEGLLDEVQIVHISGALDWPEVQAVREALPAAKRAHYHAFPYLHTEEMGEALGAADLVVSRAGAATLGELPLFGLPAILVPYPHAWRYQKVNADFLVNRGAAVRLNDEDLSRDLARLIRELLADRARLAAMGASARALATPDAAQRIARELLEMAAAAGEGAASW